MLVETYEVSEVDSEGVVECEAEAVELIEKLGLEGQKSLFSKNAEKPIRSPYRKMTKEEVNIYKAIFPEETELKKFSDEPIPVRVLQVAAHATQIYDNVYVWHSKNGDIPDPVLVGKNGSYSSTEFYILARWGTALASFAELTKIGVKIMRENAADQINEIIEKAKTKLALLETVSDGGLAREGFYIPGVYWG